MKKQIKDWHTSVTQKKNQEWLIIHIVRPDSVSNTARLFQMKASVLDKIRADFNLDKRDRQVHPLSHLNCYVTSYTDAYSSYGPQIMTIQLPGPTSLDGLRRVSCPHLKPPSRSVKMRSSDPRANDKCPVGISVHTSFSRYLDTIHFHALV